jgi:hypothetical protein
MMDKRRDAFAGTGFTDQSNRAAAWNRKTQILDRAHHAVFGAELDAELIDLDQRVGEDPA